LGLNGIYQLLVYDDDVNMLGKNVNIIKREIKSLLKASRNVGLEINAEKTMYMSMSRHQNVGPYNNNLRLLINPLKMWQYL
jgi:hypothetical protein